MQISGYTIIKQIGEGGSRTAYLAQREFCSDPIVVKVFKTGAVHERIGDQRERHTLVEILEREVEVLRRFSHPNLIRIFNHGKVDETFFIEEEYMAGGTIEDMLPYLQGYKALAFFRQIAEGVHFLHGNGILIRDLKLNNVLLSEDRQVAKLDDLELCSNLGQHALKGTRGSDRYTAPELFGQQATVQTDMYALGACLYYMLTKERETLAKINKFGRESYNAQLEGAIQRTPNIYHDLLRGCLAYAPENRFPDVLALLRTVEAVPPIQKDLLTRYQWTLPPEQDYFNRAIEDRSVLFRDAQNGDLEALIPLYDKTFERHNRLKGPREKVLEYLYDSNKNMRFLGGGYIAAVSDGEVVGAVLVRPDDFDKQGMHLHAGYDHLTAVKDAEHAIMVGALDAADMKVQRFMRLNRIKSCKIDVGLAPDEWQYQTVYEQNGFEIEGRAMHKFRFGEEVIEFGKTVVL